jgi:hypothetical protein
VGTSTVHSSGLAIGTSAASAIGVAAGQIIPAFITVTQETWRTPEVAAMQWYATTVTSETWTVATHEQVWNLVA